ncbi:MAG: hypothetical protein AAFX87_04665 [Bacteroidota bacterium]
MSNTDQKDDFYVGYMPKAPKPVAKQARLFVVITALVIITTAAVLSLNQRDYNNSQFEYGQLTTVEGWLYHEPVPIVKIYEGKDVNGKDRYKSIILINYLKFGAADLLKGYEEKIGSELPGMKVKLEGTLIYYDGVTLLELTNQENALIEIINGEVPEIINSITEFGEVTVQGEIVDPKCYFGSMKPGLGKPHRSCAIRCISGGIPPMLAISNDSGDLNYMLLVGENGEPINMEVLNYVGDAVEITGRFQMYNEWYVLYAKPDQQIKRIAKAETEGQGNEDGQVFHNASSSITICGD